MWFRVKVEAELHHDVDREKFAKEENKENGK